MTSEGGKVVLAGGSGFIGAALSRILLSRGYSVVVLTRSRHKISDDESLRYLIWDGKSSGEWVRELEGASAVINLAGRNINCRQSISNREDLLSSRVNSVCALSEAVNSCADAPGMFIQCSAVGYYGNGSEPVDESGDRGEGFLSDVCVTLEKELNDKLSADIRCVVLRLGVVLGYNGGAFPLLRKLTSCFMGGAAGSGSQKMSWIHINDLCSVLMKILSDSSMQGVYNATAPGVVSNREFMREMREVMHKPWSPAVPSLCVRLGALLTGANSDVILGGQNVVPGRLLESGFSFDYPEIGKALKVLVRGSQNA